jgi:hypothetical protein
MQEIRFEDLKAGQVYALSDPVRLAKVKGQTTAMLPMRQLDGTRMEMSQPAWEVQVTLADTPIEGAISANDAWAAAKTRRMILDREDQTEHDTIWTEIWVNAPLNKVVIREGRPAEISEKTREMRLVCHAQRGRAERHEHGSPVCQKIIVGKLLPVNVVPKNAFLSDTERSSLREKERAAEREEELRQRALREAKARKEAEMVLAK